MLPQIIHGILDWIAETSRLFVLWMSPERSWRIPLDLEINWDKGLGDDPRTYEGMYLAMQAMSRWGTLTLTGFPSQLDINTVTEGGNSVTTLAMPQLQAFKIISCGEMGNPFTRLFKIVATTSTERLTDRSHAQADAP